MTAPRTVRAVIAPNPALKGHRGRVIAVSVLAVILLGGTTTIVVTNTPDPQIEPPAVAPAAGTP